MRDPLSFKVWSTGTELTERVTTEMYPPATECRPECFSRAIRAAVIPPNFRLATGVSKFTGESKLTLGLRTTE